MKATELVNIIVSEDILFLKIKSDLEVTEINKKLPNIHWTFKLHYQSL